MAQHVRTGIAVALLCTSIVSAGCLILNPRFADELATGFWVFLVLPVSLGALFGVPFGRALWKLAKVGTNEDPERAYELLWASITAFAVFFATLALLPPFLGIFSRMETVRFGGALLLALGLAWVSALAIRNVAHTARTWVWTLLLAFPAGVILAGGTEWGRGKAPGSRVLVLALPGLSWNVAEELIEKGGMPNLERLRRSGAWGNVETIRPNLPPVVWTSVATGKDADDHGILSFSASASDIRVRRIWDILDERGWSIGLFGWPLTWPPEPMDGFVVPAVSDVGTETYPAELRFIGELAMDEKTRQRRTWGRYCRYAFLGIRYGARLGTLIDAGAEILLDPLRGRELDTAQLFRKRKLRARLNSDYFVELRRKRPVDFAAYFTNIVTVAQRYFWKYHEPDAFEGTSPEDIARYGESVHDAYRIVDEFIAKVLEDTHENDLVVVVSDHGAVASSEDAKRTLTLRVEPVLKLMHLKDAMQATNLGARTYFRMKPGTEGNPDRVRRLFETARVSRGNVRAFHARVDEWGNVVVTVRPEVADWTSDTLLFQGGRCAVSEVIRTVEFQESSEITETGTLVLNGDGIQPGRRLDGANLLDLVPTLLVLNGLDLAADLAGDVIDDALAEHVRNRIPGVVATYETGQVGPRGTQN
jgi:hypothetical protein